MHEANLRITFICLVAFVRTWICINFHSVLINEYWVAVVSPAVSLLFFFCYLSLSMNGDFMRSEHVICTRRISPRSTMWQFRRKIKIRGPRSQITFVRSQATFARLQVTFARLQARFHVLTFYSAAFEWAFRIKIKKKKKNAYNVQFSWNLITGYQT